MEASQQEPAERDTTDEWRLAPPRTPATVAELEGRIDIAIATARSAEEAALEIGAASLEAAQQARRAAALAERASATASRAAKSAAASVVAVAPGPRRARSVDSVKQAKPNGRRTATEGDRESQAAPRVNSGSATERANGSGPLPTDPFDARLDTFRRRAEKVMVRLQKLEAGGTPGRPSEVVRLR
jgi:hypothetical protein